MPRRSAKTRAHIRTEGEHFEAVFADLGSRAPKAEDLIREAGNAIGYESPAGVSLTETVVRLKGMARAMDMGARPDEMASALLAQMAALYTEPHEREVHRRFATI